jgi:peptidoglycan/xylan/chitin deacetylase (PgdA/CDA1 family)/tetratricopeptide (TPR) repeat protein
LFSQAQTAPQSGLPKLAPSHAPTNTPEAQLAREMDGVVERFRKILVLTEDEATLDPITRDRVKTIGRAVFQQNLEYLSELSGSLVTELGGKSYLRTIAFLDRMEKTGDYHDADKLAFREVLEDLADAPNLPPAIAGRVADDKAALDKIQGMYEKEIARALGDMQTRAMPVRREAWGRYMAFIKQKYQREQLLKEFGDLLPPAETRGGGRKKDPNEILSSELPPKTLLLTFDDGPHPRYTDKVLEILKKYNLQGVFFEVGKNLGTVDKNEQIKLAPTAAASYRVLQAGSAIGNHSYSHPVLPKLTAEKATEELATTNKLLKYILKQDPTLFRPPYGATNDSIRALVQTDQLKTMIWNIDSLDWADPVPASVAQRVTTEIDKNGRGIILFHDIHKVVLDVLPKLIEALQAKGYTFASWDAQGKGTKGEAALWAPAQMRGTKGATPAPEVVAPYRESWAAVIGVDNYQQWPKLRYAAHDAQGIRDVLVQKYKFKPENVFMLLDKDATREGILSLLGDKLANPDMVKRDDRVFVFFAGHGATRKLPSGRDLGYIIPVDAGLTSFEGQAISMTNFQDIAEAIPAKHLLFVMDSCYSGLALMRGAAIAVSQNYLQEIARREARQMFTAGGADQQVADNGPNGHSVFTWTLLQALDGRADLNNDGVITGSELAAYVAPAVSALSQQTPSFGNMAGSEGGDFIFELRHESEFLSGDSQQLGDDGIKLNAELGKLREQNERLTKQLADAEARLKQAEKPVAEVTPAPPPPAVPVTAAALNDLGMRLYKEKNYSEAALKFVAAAQLDDDNALFANNAGFALFKLQKYDDAVKWFEKALSIDPKRAIAYLNAGDAYVKLGRKADAQKSFEKFLELVPNGKSAPYAKEKLKELAGN